jgi:hypothetical protein
MEKPEARQALFTCPSVRAGRAPEVTNVENIVQRSFLAREIPQRSRAVPNRLTVWRHPLAAPGKGSGLCPAY